MQMLMRWCLVAAAMAMSASAADGWLEWRGPKQTGASLEKGLPEKWELGGENHLWEMELPGRGSPVIADGRLYVLGYEGEGKDLREVLVCADPDTGKRIWSKYFSDFISDIIYNRYSIGSPAVDAETGNIYVTTSPGLVVCLNRDGDILWQRSQMEELGKLTFPNGRTGSPVIDEDKLIIRGITTNWGRQGPARDRFYALDKKTGELIWASTPGVQPKDSSFSTPVFADDAAGRRVFYAGTGCGNVICADARTGEPLWRFQMSYGGVNSSVIDAGDRIVAVHGKENLDTTEIGRMIAIKKGARPGADGAQVVLEKKTHEMWRLPIMMFTSSPVFVGRRIYQTSHTGELHCVDVDSGKELWHMKLGPDQIHASPLYGDGKLYVPLHGATTDREFNGIFYILKLKDDGADVLSKVKLDGACLGAPAAWGGKIYVHTTKKLYCFGKRGGTPELAETLPAEAMPKPGKAVAMQVIPSEVLLKPGAKVPLRLRLLDDKGVTVKEVPGGEGSWEKFVPPTAKVKVKMNAMVAGGAIVADAENAPSAGAMRASYQGLKGVMRGRVLPNFPIKKDFEEFDVVIPHPKEAGVKFAWPPLPWIGARFKWEVREMDGNKVLAKTLDRVLFQRTTTFLGPPSLSNYTIEADVMSDGNRRIMSTVGLVNQRYIVALIGNWQKLEVSSNHDRIKESVDFAWQPKKWYRLKVRVDVADDGSGVVRAKAWPKGEAEPAKWLIEVEHKDAHQNGSPGLFGFSPQSQKSVFVDNISVYAND